MPKDKKSFRKFASKHLAGQIERRRQTAKGRKEQKERTEKKKIRDAKTQKREDEEHADDVAKLAETDPEFFSFLETEDPTLLEYGKVGLEYENEDGDDENENEDFEDEDNLEENEGDDAAATKKKQKKAATVAALTSSSKQQQKLRHRSAAEEDGLDEISESDTDVDEDDDDELDFNDQQDFSDESDESESDDESGKKKKKKSFEPDEDKVARRQQKQQDAEQQVTLEKLSERISASEIQELTKNKNMQDAVNIFVCAAKEMHVKDLKVSVSGGTAEAKLLSRKFETNNLVKEALYTVARLVAGGAAAALITTNASAAAASGFADASSATSTSTSKKQKHRQNKNQQQQSATSGPTFIHNKAKAIVGRYIHTAAAVLADVITSDESLAAILAHSLRAFLSVMHVIRGATKRVLRACFELCTANLETARSAGFMVILAVARRSAGTHSLYQSSIFKGLFLTLVRSVQQYTARMMPKVGFLLNAMVELYGTDLEAAYQHAFVYIRQLAVYLRAALQDPSNASNLRTVCNWQYLIALRTWAFVVSSYHENKQLGPLIHPVVQIALGVIDVFASPRMIPLHLHVIETLNHVATRARIFIPVAPHLMRILTAPAHALTNVSSGGGNQKHNSNKNQQGNDSHQNKSNKGGVVDSSFTDLQFMLRIKKAYSRSPEYILNVWLETLYLLTEHLAHLSSFISFPEATWQISTSLNKLRREKVKNPKINSLITNIVRNIDVTSQQITSKRDKGNFGPSDVTQVKMFEDELLSKGTPMTAYYNKQRQLRVSDFAAKQRIIVAGDKTTSSSENKNQNNKQKLLPSQQQEQNQKQQQQQQQQKGNKNQKQKQEKHEEDGDLEEYDFANDDEGMEQEEVENLSAGEKRGGKRRHR